MEVRVEKLEKNMAKLTVEVDVKDFVEATKKVYLREKGKIAVAGFRKGKVPQAAIERMYGEGIFWEDAANDLINSTYGEAMDKSGETIVSRPQFSLEQVGKDKNFIYTALVALKPAVSLGKYLGVTVEKGEPVNVTEEDIEAELKRQQDANAKTVEITDRPVQADDDIILDYKGTVDGVAFDGGTGTDQHLKIGSGTFIPGFEDQLIGVGVGEDKEVHVTFPEDYSAKDLAGKDAVFACTVKKITCRELPELDDEFADEVSEFSTLDEFKADIEKNIRASREKAYKEEKNSKAVRAAVEDASMDIPDAMIETRAENLADQMMQQMQMYGISPDQYMKMMNLNAQALVEQQKPQAKEQIQQALVLEAIADAENIAVTDDDYENYLKEIADQFQMSVDNVRSYYERNDESVIDMIRQRLAMDLIGDKAVEVEKKEEEKADDAVEAATAAAVEAAAADAQN